MTNNEYVILTVLRSHEFEANAKIAVREKYPFSHAASINIDTVITDKEEIKKIIDGVEVESELKPD